MRRAAVLCGLIWMGWIGGCVDPRGPITINSDDPDRKIPAIVRDVGQDNLRDIPAMVQCLGSDDPAVRFYAIQGLRRLTHDDFGYHFYETDEQRAPALRRWQEWLKQVKIPSQASSS